MSAGNLTTLASVKEYLNIASDNTEADNLLSRMIKSASAFILNYLNRETLALTEFKEIYDGYGNTFMVLRHTPVYEVQDMAFSGVPVRKAQGNGFDSPFSDGWVLEPEYTLYSAQRINLYGRVFPRARGTVAVRYKAGFVRTDRFIVPDGPHGITTPFLWLSDEGVKGEDGTVFVKVDEEPSLGQYTVSDEGVYTFNENDEDAVVFITYSFVPADIEMVACEMVGEQYKYKDRIGYVSKSLGGQETVTFSQKAMTAYNRELLASYKIVVPI